jgi:hypothetical protein
VTRALGLSAPRLAAPSGALLPLTRLAVPPVSLRPPLVVRLPGNGAVAEPAAPLDMPPRRARP